MPDFNNRTGESRVMNNGLTAIIIRYGNANDVDVQFENGGIAKGKRYLAFKRGMIRCPMLVEVCGEVAKITNPNTKKPTQFIVDIDDVQRVVDMGMWSAGNGTHGQYIKTKACSILLHRFLIMAPYHMTVDHINGDTKDNRKSNLRVCTHGDNCKNRNALGFYFHKGRGKWQAQVSANGEHYYLGLFETREGAAQAYNQAILKHHGEFARLSTA